ncbi:hypothetical protein OY671_008523, partial [Metschnikowia pulcherrima]
RSMVAQNAQVVSDPEQDEAAIAAVSEAHVTSTRATPGGAWIMRMSRAVPQLAPIRIASHRAVARASAGRVLALDPRQDPQSTEARARLCVDSGYAAIESIFDEPDSPEAPASADAARAIRAVIAPFHEYESIEHWESRMAKIKTTHVGSSPRGDESTPSSSARDGGQPYDAAEFDAKVSAAVDAAVQAQVEAGVSVVSDGESGKVGYSTYMIERSSGFGGHIDRKPAADLAEVPNLAKKSSAIMGSQEFVRARSEE